MADVTYNASVVDGGGFARNVALSSSTAAGPNPLLNTYYYVKGTGGGVRRVVPMGGAVVSGDILNWSWSSSKVYGGGVIDGTPITGAIIAGKVYGGGLVKKALPYVGYLGSPQIWLARPKTTDFVVYENDKQGPIGAARTLLDTKGWIYQVLKLGNEMVYYGQYSIMVGKYFISPAGSPSISSKTIHQLGILGKNAVCADNPFEPSGHFAVDRRYQLLVMRQGEFKIRDFSNQLSVLGSATVLSYDPRLDVVRIADGTHGFTYSVKDDALGWGPPNITGCGSRGGTFYIVAPATITTSPMSCKTDIIDLNSRDEKTIFELDFGTNVTQDLYASIDYRWDKAGGFYSTPWVKADRNGRVFLMCSGIEFQIKWKLATYSAIRLDYLPVRIKYADLKPVGTA